MSNEEKMAIERQIITEFMDYFKDNVLDFEDITVLKKLCEHIERVFKLEIEELGYKFDSVEKNNENSYELHFINDPKSPIGAFRIKDRALTEGKIVHQKPSITLNIGVLFKGLYNIDKEKRLKTCKKIFYDMLHEIQHERQDLMVMQQVSSNESLKYARDFACKECLEEEWYDKNYDNYLIENNARIVGYEDYLKIMRDEDEEILTNIGFERGKYYTGLYMVDVWTKEKTTYYFSKGSLERDKVTTTILDDLICKKSRTELLDLYPILQKEYNMDGSRKSVTELIDNMRKEIYDISENTELSEIEKDELIKDAQEMYYELIYIQLEKSTQEEINELVSKKIGKKEFIYILKEMSHYFQTQLENRLDESVKLANIQEKANEFISSSNNGTIKVEINGKISEMDFSEFIKTINPSLLEVEFLIPIEGYKVEMSAEQFIEKYIFKYLPSDGIVKLEGVEIPAKQYIEEFFLSEGILKEDYRPKFSIIDTIRSESPWKWNAESRKRLYKYYDKKICRLQELEETIGKKKIIKAFKKGIEKSLKKVKQIYRLPTNLFSVQEIGEGTLNRGLPGIEKAEDFMEGDEIQIETNVQKEIDI